MILVKRNEEKVRSDWQTLLSPSGERVFARAKNEIETNTTMIDVAVNEAWEIKQLGNFDEALRFLNIGSEIIERFTPNLLSLLSIMTKFSRMVSALAPVQPLFPADFHLAELTNLAYLNMLLSQVAISTKQRFRLKLYTIGKGISITSHYLITRIKNVVTHRSPEEREWIEIAKIGQDFSKLSEESVRSFRALLEALSNEAARDLARELYVSSDTKSLPPGR